MDYTVKHTDANGRETLTSVASVSYDSKANVLVGLGALPHAEEIKRWTAGLAYVMNQQGKTVGVYNLSTK